MKKILSLCIVSLVFVQGVIGQESIISKNVINHSHVAIYPTPIVTNKGFSNKLSNAFNFPKSCDINSSYKLFFSPTLLWRYPKMRQ